MSDILKKIDSPDFNPEQYVRELTQQCIGGQELQQQKQKIQALSEETANTLKKNVYANYMQFIETAKEISHLESEMYQLSHLLSEQRTLLGALGTTSVLGSKRDTLKQGDTGSNDSLADEVENIEESQRRQLQGIAGRIEGLSESLEVPGRALMHEGDLLELDPMTHAPLRRIHLFLLSDALMVTSWMTARRGPVRYQFDALYPLGTLAVVNARDLGSVQHAFKLLVFPDTRVFQCTSPTSKAEWLERFEGAKHAHRGSITEDKKQPKGGLMRTRTFSEEPPSESSDSEVIPPPEWFFEAPDELQVLIAQRHFEDALSLLQRVKEYVNGIPEPSALLLDIQHKVEGSKRSLAHVLMSELSAPQGRSLQGALRAARRSIKMLVLLGRASQACDLFLKLSSNSLRAEQRRARREGPQTAPGGSGIASVTSPVAKLAELFFCDLAEVAGEFMQTFQTEPACASAFVVWAGVELSMFVGHLVKHWMAPGTPLSDVAVCVESVRRPCRQLTEIGLDLGYRLEGLLRSPLEKALHDWRQRLCDSVVSRTEERWRPLNLHTKAALRSLLKEMSTLGVDLQLYVTGETWLALSPSTVSFSRQFFAIGSAAEILGAPVELRPLTEALLCDVFNAHMKVQPPPGEKVDSGFLYKNRSFLMENVLPTVTSRLEKAIGAPCAPLRALAGPAKAYSTEYL